MNIYFIKSQVRGMGCLVCTVCLSDFYPHSSPRGLATYAHVHVSVSQ